MRSRNVCLTVSAMAPVVYAVVPSATVRLLCLAWLAWAATQLPARAQCVVLYGAASFVYAAAFLLTPVADGFARLGFLPLAQPAATVVFQLALVLIGGGWLWALTRHTVPLNIGRHVPGAAGVMLWAVLLIAVHAAAWGQDICYGGDEVYHMASIHVFQIALVNILGKPVGICPVLLWIAGGAALALGPRGRCPCRGRLLIWSVAGLAIFAVLPALTYPPELLQDDFLQGRISRYPAAQPWISAVLGYAGVERWGDLRAFDVGVSRLLPLAALFAVGLVLGAHPRWRRRPAPVFALAALCIATLPTVMYYGSMVILELPLLLLMLVVLGDSRRWLTTPAPAVCRRWSWWALGLLAFTKETATPVLMILIGLRVLWQVLSARRAGRSVTGVLRREAALGMTLLAPAVLYLTLRVNAGARPYGGQLGNILNLRLWWRNAGALPGQFGFVWLAAAYGVWRLALARRREILTAAAALFFGMQAFFFADHAAYVGLARFNLFLLPPVILLAWDGLGRLAASRPKVTSVLVLLWLSVNLVMNPLNRRGERIEWGRDFCCSFPFSECLLDLRDAEPTPRRIVAANFQIEYGLSLTAQQIGWYPQLRQLPKLVQQTPRNRLSEALSIARRGQADAVIFRADGAMGIAAGYGEEGFTLWRTYEARAGTLLVFRPAADVLPTSP